MIYIHTSPTDPTSPLFFLHHPSLTFAELHLASLPNGKHLLTVASAVPPPDEVFQEFAAIIESMAPGASDQLAMFTLEKLSRDLPNFLILHASSPPNSLLIYYPAFGFAAGLHSDGTNIPPV